MTLEFAPILSRRLLRILSNLCQRFSRRPGLEGEMLKDLFGEVENGLEDELEVGLVIGDKERMLSRHFSSVSKCSGRSSHLMVMLQMGQIASVLILFAERSSASSNFGRKLS